MKSHRPILWGGLLLAFFLALGIFIYHRAVSTLFFDSGQEKAETELPTQDLAWLAVQKDKMKTEVNRQILRIEEWELSLANLLDSPVARDKRALRRQMRTLQLEKWQMQEQLNRIETASLEEWPKMAVNMRQRISS